MPEKKYYTAKDINDIISQKWFTRAVFDFGYQGIASDKSEPYKGKLLAKVWRKK